ncbi:dUTP diphosphatase [Buchnera aphidicola]|uniref:dUTP diphosphatase n=1 Tax=Buchnera aphidicola TaxID=9 RepID=UPI002092E12B|nr:dUTP diphosphatase [Buchnera aphidicola]USS94420.1 dUTP diphosphatase [Buchnera aphidicola (Sipha maydis)]
MMKKIDIKILDSCVIKRDIVLPKYSTSGSSGLDLRASINKKITIIGGQSYLIPTGLAIYIQDKSLAAILIPRSGLGHNNGIILGNSVGLIDSDYQGQIMVSLWNRSSKKYCLYPGTRIAQMVFLKISQVKFHVVKKFSKKSKRGEKGFGHTGIS